MNTIKIKAKLKLYSTNNGGRKTGIRTGYRPNHVFEYNYKGSIKQTYIGQINIDEDKWIFPGEIEIVNIEFLNVFEIEKFIQVGRKWWIHEANNKIGEAEIIEIHNTI